MNFCIVTTNYPNKINKTAYVFVQNFAWTLRDLGHEVVVVCPVNTMRCNAKALPERVTEHTLNREKLDIYFPKYRSPWICRKSAFDLIGAAAEESFKKCVEKVLDSIEFNPDVLYAQFLNPAGTAISRLREKYSCKAVASFGESSFWSIPKYSEKQVVSLLNKLDGIETVSSENKRRLLSKRIKDEKTIGVFPNAIDTRRYYQKDKKLCREKFGFPDDKFIVSYLGGFIERKGILRVDAALGDISDVCVAYGGSGLLTPKGKNVIYSSPVAPEEVADFLSASDLFVLPTQNEGCCNAIIEAMACGLPIISSDRPFNDDILTDENSVRIDPDSVQQIRNAVISLKDDKERLSKMSKKSLSIASELKIQTRVQRIVDFITLL